MGRPLRAALDRLLPGWEDSTTASLLLERKSMAYMTIALAILFLLLLVRTAVRWYGERHMGLRAMRIRSQMKRAVVAFLDTAS
jgi:ABC-type transport system involved in cytochrome bd biosynthesis fused ATPase/permease subunit